MKPLLALVGPTGVGKSETAIYLSQLVNGEIVSADSRLVYRQMDIGTAKPSKEDRTLIRHHLVDLIEPDEKFSLALYHELAIKAIHDIQKRGKLPVLVGGSGLYVWAVLEGWRTPPVPADQKLRQELSQRALNGNSEFLYDELLRVDPKSAISIGRKNTRRIIRALEVFYITGNLMSQLKKKESPGFETLIVGLTASRTELYRRIDKRIEEMVTSGLIEETNGLLKKGYTLELPSMSSIGYKQVVLYLKGELGLEEAIDQIKNASHNLARHQYAWFRLGNSRIRWFDVQSTEREEILQYIANWLGSIQKQCSVSAN